MAVAVMVAVPGPAPVIVGCTTGARAPAAIKTEFADRLARAALLVERLTVTPPLGATADKLICRLVDWPSATFVFAGICRLPKFETVTLAEVPITLATAAVAVMVVEPALTPVTGTSTELAFCGMTTDTGTVAAKALLEVRITVMLVGAGPERFSVRFCVLPEPNEMADGLNDRAEPTTTREESPVNPAALAEMFEFPKATPVIVAGTAGAVLPAAMVTVLVTTTLELLLLASAMITPPAGAGLARIT